MAAAKGKKTAGKASSGGKRTAKEQAKKPKRREIGGVVCLFLGIATFFGYFTSDAIFIKFMRDAGRGLFGWGFFILPICLIICAYILFFHHGHPVRFRVVSALLLPLIFGTLMHLLLSKGEYTISFSAFKVLFEDGLALKSGGAVSGFIGICIKPLLGVAFGSIVFIFLLVFFGMSMFNLTISGIIESMKNRPPRERLEYEEEPLPERRRRHDNGNNIKKMGVMTPENIDIPLDDVSAAAAEKSEKERKPSYFNKKPNVKTPDEFITGRTDRVFDDAPVQAVKDPANVTEPSAIPEAGIVPEPVNSVSHFENNNIPAEKLHKEPEPVPVKNEAVKMDKSEIAAQEQEVTKTIEESAAVQGTIYNYPPTTLLNPPKAGKGGAGSEEVKQNAARLESTIRSFGINAKLAGITRGPSITRYELELEAGVKLNKLTNLADDIALSLGISGVRIAPIPDKISIVGIEVPNRMVSAVTLREIIESQAFQNAKSRLSFAVGKDVSGNPVVGDISKLPHMLIAGTTGSGKSVCMNSLILSLMYKSSPDEVKFIMVDPKMVELGIYNGIPHLLIPVVTDPKKAAGALQWAVTEMLKRYRLFADAGVRDLNGYNALCDKNPGELQKMPRIVVVIDELADLMLVASKEVEESICRVAQMGRASGMHLVIATQRPSADVITGLMKANIPSRIAFAVSSAMESRIILDTQGAEKLVGKGDMLYFPLGTNKPQRIQGAFVSDEEREEVINYVKQGTEASYAEDIIDHIEKAVEKSEGGRKDDSTEESSDYDELFPDAVNVVLESGQASVSMLQRRLKLGYSRAARIVDQMEERGIVGPFEGSKPRQLLITKEQWQEMQFINGTAPIGGSGSASDELSEDE